MTSAFAWKNSGFVGVLQLLSCVQLFATPWLQPVRLHRPWNSPGKNTGGGCHFLLQGIFPTQGLNLGLLHYRQILYCLSHQGSQVVLEGTNKILHSPRCRGNKQWPTETELKLPASAGEPAVEAWVSRVSPQWLGHWQQQAGKAPGVNPLGAHHSSCHRTCRAQAWVTSGQTIPREGVQPHPLADNWIKASLSRPCSPEQDPVFPPPVPSIRKLTQAS